MPANTMPAKARVAVLCSGAGTNMAALLYASRAADCPFEIVMVASNVPDAPALALASGEGVATFALTHKGMTRADHDAAMHHALIEANADYIALAGYMRVLTDDFVASWAGRMLNIHPSLLPLYKGLDTHRRAIEAGDGHAGCSVHVVTPRLDDGPVLGQTRVAILPQDTAETLAARVLMAEHQLYGRMLAAYVTRECDPAWIEDRLSAMALALPQTSRRMSHGLPGWRVGSEKAGKFFAILFDRHHGAEAIGVLVKTSGEDEQRSLLDTLPDIYFRPAYYGAAGWIGIRLDRSNVDWDHVADWLRRSWLTAAPVKLAQSMGADQAVTS